MKGARQTDSGNNNMNCDCSDCSDEEGSSCIYFGFWALLLIFFFCLLKKI